MRAPVSGMTQFYVCSSVLSVQVQGGGRQQNISTKITSLYDQLQDKKIVTIIKLFFQNRNKQRGFAHNTMNYVA